MNYDFVGIGDIVTDAFIRLKDASVHCDVNKQNCEICMKFADKIPYEDVFIVPAVGNSPNAVFAATRLGLKAALYSNVGNDYFGSECIEALKAEKIGTDFIAINKGKKTNYHYVLWYEDDRTILIKHQDYEYKLPDLGSPKWVYLSSLGEAAAPLYPQIQKFLEASPKTKLAFQPGTYQIRMNHELKYFYERSEVFIANKEEFQRILQTKEDNVKSLMEMMKAWGPKIILLTDGPKGAYVLDDKGAWFMPIYPDPKPPHERTGAGDAFSSTFVSALALGLSPREAIRWAPINSMSVVQFVGAREGLLTKDKIEKYLKEAPLDYTLKPLP